MHAISDGQCGLCKHYGEGEDDSAGLVQIRVAKQAPVDVTHECGHPQNKPLHLLVTPVSGCSGFEAAA
ncbi:MAG: hypothetical protein AAF612_00985 [Planctomycetota bacterium]